MFTLWVLLVVFFTLSVLISFLCSLCESSLLSMTYAYIGEVAQQDPEKGKILRKLKKNVEKPLAAILTLNTVANTIGAVAVGAVSAELFGSEFVMLISLIMSLCILIFAEIIPKSLGAYFWKTLIKPVSTILNFLIVVFTPFVKLTVFINSLFAKNRDKPDITRNEIFILAELARRHEEISNNEATILENLILMNKHQAKDIMTPRPVMLYLDSSMTVKEFIKIHLNSPYSRIPVYSENEENIDGLILKNDIFKAALNGENDKKLSDFRRKLKAVPESVPVSELIYILTEKKYHMIMLVDEYGNVMGIVTLEDVVETLIGRSIEDESDHISNLRNFALKNWKAKLDVFSQNKEMLGADKNDNPLK